MQRDTSERYLRLQDIALFLQLPDVSATDRARAIDAIPDVLLPEQPEPNQPPEESDHGEP